MKRCGLFFRSVAHNGRLGELCSRCADGKPFVPSSVCFFVWRGYAL
ncbi:zinc finger domain-containing protein [Phormidium sp. CCY1219]|nr:hypothetical protein [Phormidium sp. CCY1219]